MTEKKERQRHLWSLVNILPGLPNLQCGNFLPVFLDTTPRTILAPFGTMTRESLTGVLLCLRHSAFHERKGEMMHTEKGSPDRRNFLKCAGPASLATLVVAGGGTAFAQTTKKGRPTDGTSYTYATENSWGPITEWHDAADLSFTVESGTGSAPASLSWRDQQGNSFAISFASDMSTFFGYFQRVNEGPIAYRGTLK